MHKNITQLTIALLLLSFTSFAQTSFNKRPTDLDKLAFKVLQQFNHDAQTDEVLWQKVFSTHGFDEREDVADWYIRLHFSEQYTRFLYHYVFERPGSDEEINSFLDKYKGRSPEEMLTMMLSSAEFFEGKNEDPTAFVSAVIKKGFRQVADCPDCNDFNAAELYEVDGRISYIYTKVINDKNAKHNNFAIIKHFFRGTYNPKEELTASELHEPLFYLITGGID